jgi:hypothetical protein
MHGLIIVGNPFLEPFVQCREALQYFFICQFIANLLYWLFLTGERQANINIADGHKSAQILASQG